MPRRPAVRRVAVVSWRPIVPSPMRFACRADGDGPEMVRIVAQCPECGERFVSPAFDMSKLKELESRHVQDVFPDWPPATRELFFMSGICGACWDKIMTL